MALHINSACQFRVTPPVLWENFYMEQFRVATFCKYPHIAAISALVLAANGFVYVGTGLDEDDSVRCCFCGRGKRSWLKNEDVQRTHTQLSPSCPMVTGVNCTNIRFASRVRGDYSFNNVEMLLNQHGKAYSVKGLHAESVQECGQLQNESVQGCGQLHNESVQGRGQLHNESGEGRGQFQSKLGAGHEKIAKTPNPRGITINLQQTPPFSNTYSARSTHTLTPSPVVQCPVSLKQSATSAAQPIQMQASMCDNPRGGELEPSTNDITDAADVSRNETLVTLPRSSLQQDQENWRVVTTSNEQQVFLRNSLIDINIERPMTTTGNAEMARVTTGHRCIVAESTRRPTMTHAIAARQQEESRARHHTTRCQSIGDVVIPRVEFEHNPTAHSGNLDLLNIPEVAKMAEIIPNDKLLTAVSQLRSRDEQVSSKNILIFANRLC